MSCPRCSAPTKYVHAEPDPMRDFVTITCLNCGMENQPWSSETLANFGVLEAST